MGYKSDIEIAQECKLLDIREIAKKLGLTEDDLEDVYKRQRLCFKWRLGCDNQRPSHG